MYLQVVVLPLLLSLEVETGQPAQVLLAHRLVHGGAAADPLTVVVGRVGPPVSLGLDVAEDHVLDWRRQAWHLGTFETCIHWFSFLFEENMLEKRHYMAFH